MFEKNSSPINFTFVDSDDKTIQFLKKENKITIKYMKEQKLVKQEFSGFKIVNIEEVSKNIEDYLDIDIITTSVGVNNLSKLTNTIERIVEKSKKSILIMCCENGNRVSSGFKKEFHEKIAAKINFVDCAIDRIIPNQNFIQNGYLLTEEYSNWVVDANQWPMGFQKISSIKYSDDLDYEMKIKLCLLNGSHSALSWYRYNIDRFDGIKTVADSLKNEETLEFLKGYVLEVSKALSKNNEKLLNLNKEFAKKVIERFKNPLFNDELSRVGRNPMVKLKKGERVFIPLEEAVKTNSSYKFILTTLKNGLNYWNVDDEESKIIRKVLFEEGFSALLHTCLEFDEKLINVLKEEM
ncbi:mannitol-1-phosphate 5-dehydrogenase [Spiroplasma chinense]|uniref:Mannitol-1-phosphate 5-dehydrogenase n=2 Tax=Spiroplasma chinense TaxID=216932 RepID=A0A5B9Y473_9MOLU|nr:mannitol-1-phosphate 5-dehydrogenase [Spiroplasma chinense]